MHRSGYLRDRNGHQTLRRRPPQRVKQKKTLSSPCSRPSSRRQPLHLGWQVYSVADAKGVRLDRKIHTQRTKYSFKEKQIKGPLTTGEISKQRIPCLKSVQESFKTDERFEQHRLQLNLQPNENWLLECRGRIQAVYPIYVPELPQFARKLVEEAHDRTLHGGVRLTMAKIREKYWNPRLRRLARKVVKACNGCKQFHATAFINPPPGQLPKDRTEGENARSGFCWTSETS